MNSKIIRWTFAAGFAVAAFAGSGAFAILRRLLTRRTTTSPVWPTAKPSNRLYVGGLSMHPGIEEGHAHFNPKEFKADKSCPGRSNGRYLREVTLVPIGVSKLPSPATL